MILIANELVAFHHFNSVQCFFWLVRHLQHAQPIHNLDHWAFPIYKFIDAHVTMSGLLPQHIRAAQYPLCRNNWRAQLKKGITVFDDPKRSKVNNNFLVSRKITRLDFNSTQIQLLNFSHNSLLDNENASLTFDLLGSSKPVIPFFHWALQL